MEVEMNIFFIEQKTDAANNIYYDLYNLQPSQGATITLLMSDFINGTIPR